MGEERVLIIEGDTSVRIALETLLMRGGYHAEAVDNGFRAIDLAKKKTFQIFLIDFYLNQTDGIHLLKEIKKEDPHAACIMTTGDGTVELSVKAMKAGAFDFLTKPIPPDRLFSSI